MGKTELLSKRIQQIKNNLPKFTWNDLDEQAMIYEMTASDIEPAEFPRIYQIETTAQCNLRCKFCPRTFDMYFNWPRLRYPSSRTMPIGFFESIIVQMPWLKSIELFHFGEPFLQYEFFRFVYACKQRGIYTVVASNLTVPSEKNLERIISAGLDFLVIDLDTLDPEEYDKIRPGRNDPNSYNVPTPFDKLKRNLQFILDHPKHQRPYVVVQAIMLDGKPPYTPEQFYEWIGEGRRPNELRYKFLDSFRNNVVKKKVEKYVVCREPFYGFTVHVNGNVVPCDRDWRGEYVMGNLTVDSPMDIWNGEKFKAFREAMKSNKKPKMCLECPERILYNARSQPHIQVNMFKGRWVK